MKSMPKQLHASYNWIDSAGEWAEALANPEQYAADAAANARENEVADVTKSDLIEAIRWREKALRRGDCTK